MDELEIVQYQQVNGLSVFLNTVSYRAPHFHKEWEFLWVLDNPLKITCMQTTQVIEPGEIVLFPPNMPHRLQQSDQVSTFLCLQISPSAFSNAASITTNDIRLKSHLSDEDYHWIQNTALEIALAYFKMDQYYEMFCLGMSGLLMYRLMKNLDCRVISAEEAKLFDKQNTRLLHLVSFVEKNHTHKIRLQDFAEQENCSLSYLSHFIKDTMNQTFHEYVDSVRFAHACELIHNSDKTMIEISIESGFSDYRYFSRAFQKYCGLTPSEYSHQAHSTLRNSDLESHSVHSQERLLNRAESLDLLEHFKQTLTQADA